MRELLERCSSIYLAPAAHEEEGECVPDQVELDAVEAFPRDHPIRRRHASLADDCEVHEQDGQKFVISGILLLRCSSLRPSVDELLLVGVEQRFLYAVLRVVVAASSMCLS